MEQGKFERKAMNFKAFLSQKIMSVFRPICKRFFKEDINDSPVGTFTYVMNRKLLFLRATMVTLFYVSSIEHFGFGSID